MDIVKQLTLWVATQPRTHGANLVLEAISYIEELQKELEEEARINGMGGEREARLMAIVAERESEIARLRLTDAEREAVEQAADFIDAKSYASADTLRGLLEKTKENA